MNVDNPTDRRAQYPIVCIGMSAGAVKPLEELFRSLSPATGMAFVVIHHLRSHPTLLHRMLPCCTSMPVHLVDEGIKVHPNEVYVIPSGKEMTLMDGTLELKPRSRVHGWANVVSIFINSLAKSQHCGIVVILSGMDEDGSEALKAFKEHGGITIAQAPETASYRGMPDAAIKSGSVDYVLAPENISSQLNEIAAKFRSRDIKNVRK